MNKLIKKLTCLSLSTKLGCAAVFLHEEAAVPSVGLGEDGLSPCQAHHTGCVSSCGPSPCCRWAEASPAPP